MRTPFSYAPLDPLVLAEEITDFTAADTHITCGNVDAGSDMTAELGHEALAEIHDFLIGLCLWDRSRNRPYRRPWEGW